jgi:general secretion pathway protein D
MTSIFMRLWAVALLSLAASAATIRFDPPSGLTSVGGIVNVNVSIANVTDLYAYQFDLAFDAGVLSASTVSEGAFLSGGGATFFVPGTIDNAAGTITFTVNTLLGPTPGVSGTGALAGIRFNGEAVGTSAVTLSNVVLLDSAGTDIVATVENGSVAVSSAVIPEPRSAALVVAGAVALLVFGRRFRSTR